MTTVIETLKSCPFCDGDARRRLAVGETWVECLDCGANTKMASNTPFAVKAWNTRVSTLPEPSRVRGEDREKMAAIIADHLIGEGSWHSLRILPGFGQITQADILGAVDALLQNKEAT